MDPATPGPVRVECYAGGRADEEPRAIVADGRRREVAAVLSRARTPAEQRFVVRLEDGETRTLVQDLASGRWRVELGRAGGPS